MKLPRRALLPVAVLATLIHAAPAMGQGTVVKLATLVPDGSAWDKILKEMGAQWSQGTQGRVTLRIYPGGVAGDEPDVVRKMRIGQLQAAAVTTNGLAEIDPAFKMFGIPMFFDSYAELHAVLDRMEPMLKQRLEAKGFVLLNWGHGGWVYFFTRQPASGVEELKKAKLFVWAGDDRMNQIWKETGFQTVALAATDILTGLQTGMIESFPTTPLLASTVGWFHQASNMVGVGMAPLVGGLVITKQAWNRISEGDRAVLQAACGRAERRLEVEIPRQDTTAVSEMQKRGLKVTAVTPQQAAAWRAAAADFAARMRGTIVPAEVLDLAVGERDAYRSRGAGGAR